MQTKKKSLWRNRCVVTLLLILAFIILNIGCGASYLKTYRSNLYGPDGPNYRVVEWKIEHNLFNSKYQKVDQEDLEEDSPG